MWATLVTGERVQVIRERWYTDRSGRRVHVADYHDQHGNVRTAEVRPDEADTAPGIWRRVNYWR